MESALEMLEDHDKLHSSGISHRAVPEQIKLRVALLFHYMRNYVFHFHSEMRLPEDKSNSKSEKNYCIGTETAEEKGEEQIQ